MKGTGRLSTTDGTPCPGRTINNPGGFLSLFLSSNPVSVVFWPFSFILSNREGKYSDTPVGQHP
ncbi:hypothetical protein BJX96DRAFT_157032 [Aspergillus floccosus]